jgi:hypothetical protein
MGGICWRVIFRILLIADVVKNQMFLKNTVIKFDHERKTLLLSPKYSLAPKLFP